jgi:hypothetical protein
MGRLRGYFQAQPLRGERQVNGFAFQLGALFANLGIPRRWLKTKKQVEATRRRSEAAKKGWAKRRANKAA